MLAVAVAALLAVAGQAAASPAQPHLARAIIERQLSSSSIPSACQSTCSGALTIYNACLSGDETTCLSVCQSSNYNNFVSCFSCILEDSQGVTQAEYTELASDVLTLQQACAAAGETVSATASLVPYASLTGTTGGTATGGSGNSGTSIRSATASGASNAIGTGTVLATGASGITTTTGLGTVAASGVAQSLSSAQASISSAAHSASAVASSSASASSASASIKLSAAGVTAGLPGTGALGLGVAVVAVALGAALL